jgi:Ca2+-binding RTX toxin-like protein
MHKLFRLRESRTPRLATSATALVVAVVAAAGISAGKGSAAPAPKAHEASHHCAASHIRRPKLRHGALTVEGTSGNDTIALRLQAGDPNTLEVDITSGRASAEFSFDRQRVTSIAVDAGSGDDVVSIDDGNGTFTDTIPTTIDGGVGNDTIAGGKGNERLFGGAGNDSIDGNGGNDTAFLGAGDDTFVWDPGDGSDTVEGQDGTDTMLFNGADAAERVSLSANGHRLTFLRSPGAITMDTAGVERVDFNAVGGADVVTVSDLSGTDVKNVNLDLGAGDGQRDAVFVHGTTGDDTINVSGDASAVAVSGLSAHVALRHQESTDELEVDGLGGNDAISAAGLTADAITLTLDGGDGNDTIAGGQGNDSLLGSDGNDTIDGNGGNDSAVLGAGDDTFVWDPGDGSDTIDGEDGTDTMLFNGAAGAEQMDLSANANRLRFFRTQGNVTMSTGSVETVDVNALGGADTVTVNDLSGTDVQDVNVDLAGTLGGATGDGQPDRIVVNGTAGDDSIGVFGDSGSVNVKGLAPFVQILHAEAANDRLEINTLAGTDTVDSSGLAAGVIQLIVDGTPTL